jgi:hypothetical protein
MTNTLPNRHLCHRDDDSAGCTSGLPSVKGRLAVVRFQRSCDTVASFLTDGTAFVRDSYLLAVLVVGLIWSAGADVAQSRLLVIVPFGIDALGDGREAVERLPVHARIEFGRGGEMLEAQPFALAVEFL